MELKLKDALALFILVALGVFSALVLLHLIVGERLANISNGIHYTTNWSQAAGDETGGYIAELTSQPDGTIGLYELDSAPPDDFVVDATGQMLPVVVADPVVVSGQQVEKLSE